VVRFLPRLDVEPPGRPAPPDPPHGMRGVTRSVAFDSPESWTPERAAKVAALFDELAPSWNERMAEPQRTAPLEDAYARGGIAPGGRCLEVGSGTGANTPFLAAHHDSVVAADLSPGMLALAPAAAGARIRADSSASPIRTGAMDVVVLVNALLFPAETARVLSPDGVIVWVNTAGDLTPIYLPAEDVDQALPGEWDAVASEAGRGTWAVLRRSTGS
jgi:SAM-dependent methyltransferase